MVKSAFAMASSTLRTKSEKSGKLAHHLRKVTLAFGVVLATKRSSAWPTPNHAGNSVAALHPAEDPGDGAQVVQAAPLRAARRARADARVLQFVHRRGLFEVFEHLGILGDVARGRKRRRRCDICSIAGAQRGSAPGAGRRCAGSASRRGGDHHLQVPLRQHRVGILPVEHFALLGDANLAGESADRLGE